MTFGGGGGGAISPHVHDNTPLQGGPLDMAGTTIGSLNAGSITYSDGAALQELAIGGASENLTVSGGGLPQWTASGATGATELIGKFTQVATTDQEFSGSFTSVDLDDYDIIGVCSCNANTGTPGRLSCRWNDDSNFQFVSCFWSDGNLHTTGNVYANNASGGSSVSAQLNVPDAFCMSFTLTSGAQTSRSPMYFNSWITNQWNIFGVAWLDGPLASVDEFQLRKDDGTNLVNYLTNAEFTLWKRSKI